MDADDPGMRQRIRTTSLTGTHLKKKTKRTDDKQAKKDKSNKNIYNKNQTNEKRGKTTTSWQNNFSRIKGPTWVKKSPLKKITVKYLRHRWTRLGEKSPISISGADGPIRAKKSSQNILSTDGPT